MCETQTLLRIGTLERRITEMESGQIGHRREDLDKRLLADDTPRILRTTKAERAFLLQVLAIPQKQAA